MPDKKPRRTVQRVDPASINIEAHVRDEIDTEALARALIDVVPLLDAETQEKLQVEGAKILKQMEDKSSGNSSSVV